MYVQAEHCVDSFTELLSLQMEPYGVASACCAIAACVSAPHTMQRVWASDLTQLHQHEAANNICMRHISLAQQRTGAFMHTFGAGPQGKCSHLATRARVTKWRMMRPGRSDGMHLPRENTSMLRGWSSARYSASCTRLARSVLDS